MIKSVIKSSTYIMVMLIASYAIYLNIFDKTLMSWWCVEDGLVQNVQAVLLFLTSAVFFYLFFAHRSANKWYLLFALFFFWTIGEEISWGQRIFGLATPVILEKYNIQHEINIHNINGIHQHIRFVGLLGILLLTMVVPLTNKFLPKFRKIYTASKFPILPLWVSGIIIIASLFSIIPRLIYHVKAFNPDEVSELLLYVAFFLFAASLLDERLSHNTK